MIFVIWFYTELLYHALYLLGMSGKIDNFFVDALQSEIGTFNVYVIATLNTAIFYIALFNRLLSEVLTRYGWGESLDISGTPHFENTQSLIDLEAHKITPQICLYPTMKDKSLYRSVMIILNNSIDYKNVKDSQYRLTQNIPIRQELIYLAFEKLSIHRNRNIVIQRFTVLGETCALHLHPITKNNFLAIVDEFLHELLTLHLFPFKLPQLPKLEEYQTLTVEKLSANCPFGIIQSFHVIYSNQYVVQILLPTSLPIELFKPIKIAGFIAQEESLNTALLQKAISANQYRSKANWHGSLAQVDSVVELTVPQKDLTVIRLHEWLEALKKQLIEHSPSVLNAREKINLLAEIQKLLQERNSLLEKIKILKCGLNQHANSTGAAEKSEDIIPKNYVAKYKNFEIVANKFNDVCSKIEANLSVHLNLLKQMRSTLFTELEKFNQLHDELQACETALSHAEKKYINYLSAMNKKLKPIETVLPEPVLSKEPVIETVVEEEIAQPLQEIRVEPPALVSTSSNSTSYNLDDFPDRIIVGKKQPQFFQASIEQTLSPQGVALHTYVNRIVDKMTHSRDLLVAQQNHLSRKAIYRLIDQFACLHLALQEMAQQKILSKMGVVAIVRSCRDWLRHNSTQFIDGNLNSQLRLIISNLKINIDKEIRSPIVLANTQALEEITSILIEPTEEAHRISFLTDLEFLKNESVRTEIDYDFYSGFLSQLGNHLHAFKEQSPALFKGLLNRDRNTKMLEIDDFKSMNRKTIMESLNDLHPANLLYLCLQIRNIRGHEMDAEMILPLYQISPNTYIDSLSDDVKEAVFIGFFSKLSKIEHHVESNFRVENTDRILISNAL